ncbi:4'-phosphopantetheinyl transferase family protein [Pseudomonas oryzae]|uniref:Enterobactin synthase component D n=1 Tax=Pseudomonas oryzae TaxID=1392877 RepID=A0A1H1THL2_9PSED|nr:4'-phosphopantetheinyl transferase superfamily protein [Pseudomonas oryzae]SDS59674.1 enterobactin synthetase component D [Pseudomonas oryzae]
MSAPPFHTPPFCSAPAAAWPLPLPLPGLILHSCRFDPAQLADDDFARCGLIPPPAIAGAAAKRRSEFLAGRLCAASALLDLHGRPAYPARGADNAPCWPAGSLGSITHSHGWAAALVGAQSAWRGLGLDAEPLIPASRAERLAGEILTADELAQFLHLPTEERGRYLTLCFSLKESLFKALYPLVQRRFWFQAAALVEQDGNGRVRLQLREELGGEWTPGTCLEGQFARHEERLLSLVAIPAH